MKQRTSLSTSLFFTLFLLFSGSAFSQSYTYTLWNWLPEYEKNFWELAVQEFNKSNNNTTIKLDYQKMDYLDMIPAIRAGANSSSGNLPDIQTIEFNQWPGYLREGVDNFFVPMNDIVAKEKGNLSEAHLQEYRANGNKYAISFQASPLVVFYRTDLVTGTGEGDPFPTWYDFSQHYKKSVTNGDPLVAIDIFDFQTFHGLFLQHGGQFMKGSQPALDASSTEILKSVLSYFKSINDAGAENFSVAEFVAGTFDEDIKNGKLAGFVMPDWVLPILKERFPDLEGKWKMQALPTWSSGYKGVAVGGTGYAIVKKANRSAQAEQTLRDFMYFAVYSLKMQSIYYKNFSLQMSNLQLANNKAAILFTDSYFGNQKLALDLREQLKDMAPRPMNESIVNMQALYEQNLLQFFDGSFTMEEFIQQIRSSMN